MKLTPEALQEMSDFEINVIIAKLIHTGLAGISAARACDDSAEFYDSFQRLEYNYCQNPNDIMPIAFENYISTDWLVRKPDKWQAKASNQGTAGPFKRFESINTNPLRAICECFILMNQ
jgi:hypothetical protein